MIFEKKIPIPFLTIADFIRLIRSATSTFLRQKQGIPPDLPCVECYAELILFDIFNNSLPFFHKFMINFFGLSHMVEPGQCEKIGTYAERLHLAWLAGGMQIVFYTSGSTGKPVPHLHTPESLWQEALSVAKLFSHLRRFVVTVPLTHSYGFIFGLLVPKLLAVEALDEPLLGVLSTDECEDGELIVTFPLLLSRLDKSPEKDVTLLSATAPLPERLFNILLNLGYNKLFEIYGTSETGAIGWRSGPKPFKLLEHWRKTENGDLIRLLPDGSESKIDWLDNVQHIDINSFRLIGRRDKAIQVGGINVYPAKVAALITEHPLVVACTVRLGGGIYGERLKAFVVLSAGANENVVRQDLLCMFKSKLKPPERPRHLIFGPALPISILGKEQDWPITNNSIANSLN